VLYSPHSVLAWTPLGRGYTRGTVCRESMRHMNVKGDVEQEGLIDGRR
jgi:hypothetical protein